MVEISWPLERHFHFPLLTNHHIYLSPPSFTLSVSLCLSLSRCDALLLPLNCFPIAIFHICCRLHNAYDCYFVWLHLIQFDSISFELISFATRTHLAFSLVVSYLDSRTIALYMYAYVCICILHAQRDLIYLSLSLYFPRVSFAYWCAETKPRNHKERKRINLPIGIWIWSSISDTRFPKRVSKVFHFLFVSCCFFCTFISVHYFWLLFNILSFGIHFVL